MTPEMQGPPPYETRCPRCKVSYPIETRRCIHCGGRTERPARGAEVAPPSLAPSPGRLRRTREAPRGAPPSARRPAPPPAPLPQPAPPPPQGDEDDDELPVRRGMTRGLSLVWVALAIAASLYRACTGEGPG